MALPRYTKLARERARDSASSRLRPTDQALLQHLQARLMGARVPGRKRCVDNRLRLDTSDERTQSGNIFEIMAMAGDGLIACVQARFAFVLGRNSPCTSWPRLMLSRATAEPITPPAPSTNRRICDPAFVIRAGVSRAT
jgi:hypothetical protein